MKHLMWKIAVLALCLVLAGAPARATAASSSGQSGTLRVYLKSLGEPASLTLRLTGSYSIDGNTGLYFDRGTEIAAAARSGQVWLSCGGLQMNMGAGVTLTRHQAEGENGVYISGSARDNLYCGSLELNADGDVLQAVLIIDVEEYLKGVLPYEMNDAFPLEALKAQAVAARTYALRRRADRGSKNYDLVDTPADQVFYGYDASWRNAIAAVEATRGVCGLYNGQYASCYYTATNGGQTALPGDVLSASGGNAYLDIHDDPYDLENPQSPVSTLAFSKDLSDAPALFTGWLAAAAAERLGAMGFSEETADIRPDAVLSLTPHDTKAGPENRMYQYLTVTYTLSARPMEPVYAEPSVEERVYHAFTKRPLDRRIIGYEAGAWTALPDEFTCELTVYDQLKDDLGMKLSGLDCELTTVIEEEDIFVIQMRRYGHGVGMSQRGAQTMAGSHGMSCMDILAFYYPGLAFENVSLADETLPPLSSLPAAGARDEKIFLPEPGENEYIATVHLSTIWSTLNVRSAPSTDAPILTELKNGAQVVVVSEENGWTRVRTGSVEGYVSSQYLSAESE
ncbi:MAG: SpoIID/LytB domain-containing protein [Clostridia bacterium]|nr:SpoIID/LytB domain-containing protein [Clostridia bacterium]